jgi:hypothetical protein
MCADRPVRQIQPLCDVSVREPLGDELGDLKLLGGQHTMAERIGATVSEVAASHSVYLSQPEAVATLIAQAAAGAAER